MLTLTNSKIPNMNNKVYPPNILLSSALWRSGFWTASRFRSSFAHTIKAFMGLLMRGSEPLSAAPLCVQCPSGSSVSRGERSKLSGHEE